MKTIALVLASCGIMFAASAYANPIAFEVARIREVPGPHVQLTYAVEPSKTPQTPSVAATYGSKSTAWKTASYRANSGSGVRPLAGIQMCDCNVPLGQSLVYKLTAASAYDGRTVDFSLTVTPTGAGKYDASVVDATPGDASVMPWDIPDPVEIQGIDCAAECTAHPLDGGSSPLDAQASEAGGADGTVVDVPLVVDVADVATGAGGTMGAGGAVGTGGIVGSGGVSVIAGAGGALPTTGAGGAVGAGGSSAATTKPTKSDGGGCSLARGGGSPGLVGLAVGLGLGLALIGRRKRRA